MQGVRGSNPLTSATEVPDKEPFISLSRFENMLETSFDSYLCSYESTGVHVGATGKACRSMRFISLLVTFQYRTDTQLRVIGCRKRWTLGLATVDRTNSWPSNFGQLRRSTDRIAVQRLAALALAITLIITVNLVK